MSNDGIMLTIGEDGIARAYDDTYDITIHCESEEEQERAKKLLMERMELQRTQIAYGGETKLQWIPVTDGDEWKPPVDEDGESDLILLSFENFPNSCIGVYREDEEGGAFFCEDDDDPLTSIGLFVNAWMPLPAPYREE